tara:strand:- start:58102 stop:58818 length:717 start_codon:yes stop_codon:yes gene_type:complete
MKMIQRILFILLTSYIVSGQAQVPDYLSPCEEKVEKINGFQFQSGQLKTDDQLPKKCFIMISPIDNNNSVYRSYIFNTQGQMLVFNSFGAGDPSKNTGSSVHYFFPFKSELKYLISGDAILIELINGEVAQFDTVEGKITEMTNAIVHTDPDINRNNNGGVQFEYLEGWTMNAGFQLGGSPLSNPVKEIYIRDSLGTQCDLKINDFFMNINEEYFLKYSSNDELQVFQSDFCPQLNIW